MAPTPTGSLSVINNTAEMGKNLVFLAGPPNSLWFFPPFPHPQCCFFLLLQHVIPISCVPGQPTQSQFRAGACL